MRKFLPAVLLAATASCNSNPVAVTGWPFDPLQLFTGHTRGRAQLHLITGASHAIAVDSHGTPDGHGGLVLDQTIGEQGHAPRVRRWLIHPAGANRWTGTLTDADGPVSIQRTRADVVIRYRMHNGSKVEQHLDAPPGRPVDNHMTVTRFGVRLAWLDEQIRKTPT